MSKTTAECKFLRRMWTVLGLVIIPLVVADSCTNKPAQRHLSRAERLRDEGTYLEACKEYQKIEIKYPESPLAGNALFEQGITYYLFLNDYKSALEAFQRLISSHPDSGFCVTAQNHVAEIHMTLMDFKKAVVEYQKILDNHPGREDADGFHYQIAQCYFHINDFRQARVEYGILLENFPRTKLASDVYSQIATCNYLEGRLEEAVESYREVIRRFPKDKASIHAQFGIASCLEEMEKLPKALDAYEKILDHYGDKKVVQIRIDSIRKRLEKRNR